MTGAEDKILDAAEKMFAELGYAGTTTRALASRAGVNEVTVFRRYGSKLGVLLAVFERAGVGSVREQVASAMEGSDPAEALTAMARREIDTSAKHGAVALRIAFEARSTPELGDLMGEGPERNLEALAAMFARWQADGAVRGDIDPRLLAEAFASLTSSVVMYRQVMGLPLTEGLTDGEIARQLTEVFLHGALVGGTAPAREGGSLGPGKKR